MRTYEAPNVLAALIPKWDFENLSNKKSSCGKKNFVFRSGRGKDFFKSVLIQAVSRNESESLAQLEFEIKSLKEDFRNDFKRETMRMSISTPIT